MTVSHKVGISTLQICNNSSNIVSNVIISVASSDSSDPVGTLETNWISIPLKTTSGTSAAGFVTYTNLTESEVLSWSDISNHVDVTKEKNEIFINEKINSSHISKELPW